MLFVLYRNARRQVRRDTRRAAFPVCTIDASAMNVMRLFATEVVEKLRRAGHQALWAGGCVRDQLLGIEPDDYDVATDARPEQVAALFRRTLHVGASFGVVEVLGPRKAGQQVKVQV